MVFAVRVRPYITNSVLKVTGVIDNETRTFVFTVAVADYQSAAREDTYVKLSLVRVCIESQRFLRCNVDELIPDGVFTVETVVNFRS